MAIVSGYTITKEQYEEFLMWEGDGSEREYRISCWPDGSVTVDDGDTIIIEFVAE